MIRRVAAAAACIALTATPLACSGAERSVASVCHVWETDGVALHDGYTAAGADFGKNPLNGILTALQALSPW